MISRTERAGKIKIIFSALACFETPSKDCRQLILVYSQMSKDLVRMDFTACLHSSNLAEFERVPTS